MEKNTRRIWTGLVNYANGTASIAEIRTTAAYCMGWIAATAQSLTNLFDPMFTDDEYLPKQAEQYRASVEVLLRFLCSEPKSEARKSLRSQALTFLDEHGDHIQGLDLKELTYDEKLFQNLKFTDAEIENYKKQIRRVWNDAQYETSHRGQSTIVGTDLLPLGLMVPSKHYKDLADPICDFLSSEYLKFLNREYSRRDKEPAPLVPIFVCPRCYKLVMPKRIGRRQYCSNCSDRARAVKYRQKASLDEGRDYAWLYRLKREEPTTRNARLRQKKVQERIREIKSRQKESSRCQGLLQAMNL